MSSLTLRNTLSSLAIVAFLVGCGGGAAKPSAPVEGPKKAENTAPTTGTKWKTAQEVLAAAPQTPLVDIELTWQGDTYLLSAPAGSRAEGSEGGGDAQITAMIAPNLKIEFIPGKLVTDEWKAHMLLIDPVKEWTYVDDQLKILERRRDTQYRYEGFANVNLGYRAFRARFDKKDRNYNESLTLDETLLLLKVASTLRLKEPFPADPVAALKRLKHEFEPKTDDPAKIEKVTFSYYTVAGQLAVLEKLPNLKNLRIDTTWLEEGDFGPLAKCASVESLTFYGGGKEPIYLAAASCKSLKRFSVPSGSGCNATAKGLAALAGLGKLEELQVDVPEDAFEGVKAFESLKNLRVLEVMVCAKKDDQFALNGRLEPLTKIPSLRELKLRCILTDADAELLGKFTGLESLELLDVSVTDAGLAPLGKLKGLKTLRIGGKTSLFADDKEAKNIKITGKGLAAFKDLAALEELTFSGTPIPDENIEHWKQLKDLPALKKLGLTSSTKITPKSLAALKEAMPKVEIKESSW